MLVWTKIWIYIQQKLQTNPIPSIIHSFHHEFLFINILLPRVPRKCAINLATYCHAFLYRSMFSVKLHRQGKFSSIFSLPLRSVHRRKFQVSFVINENLCFRCLQKANFLKLKFISKQFSMSVSFLLSTPSGVLYPFGYIFRSFFLYLLWDSHDVSFHSFSVSHIKTDYIFIRV